MTTELIYCACGCGQQRTKYDKRGRERKLILHHQLKGENCTLYKGGSLDKKGYRRIHLNNGKRVAQHRHIYEKYHKVCLLKWVDIHHKDGNKLNNDINNLQAVFHNKHHVKDKSDWFCLLCGSKTTQIDKTGHHHWLDYNKDGSHMCNRCYMKKFHSRRHLLKNTSSYELVGGKVPPLKKYFSNISKK